MITTLIIFLLYRLFGRSSTKIDERRVQEAFDYCTARCLNTNYCLLVDFSMQSGKSRLHVWDFEKNSTVMSCPVAHGRGQGRKKTKAIEFSNEPNSYLSSLGKAKIAERYVGEFGVAYRIDGLEDSNNNVRARNIVIHGSPKMPTKDIYPLKSPTSRGCFMVSDENMSLIDNLLRDQTDVLLFCYC